MRQALPLHPDVLARGHGSDRAGGNRDRGRRATAVADPDAMYVRWAANRNMHVTEQRVLGQRVLVVAGFGAHAILSREAGLHVVDDDTGAAGRIAARVRVAADEPGGPRPHTLRDARWAGLLGAPVQAGEIVRRYRRGAAPLVRDARGSWRTGRLDLVPSGHFDLIADMQDG